ncbi:SDR family NAD(P)-dependent oxidoreductase [Mycobacterium sp. CBMA271]|uniref:oxidoreductase n=1 Tax=unclassified Mycobacteroides TaxID=2618759 RepID=UPI001324A809|nr:MULTISPECIES: oxidoreductase [unclassified Mycobacteroides]MUM15617.1 oxidoreductase [Mycobacteroides sp. CBMA 326]MUM17412.1 oxidoreductase [Mycobacteroides sp. CBMA 326]MUM21887.1 SDR family NAD(P)-dependent oxidoreductase [Mycobacteroides sp. CBMA 271]
MTTWTAAELPSFEGRTVIITGANSGLGLETARELARVGAHVIMAVRNTEKGNAAKASIKGSTELRQVDVANLASVRAFADSVDRADILVNNAGIMMVPQAKTADGFESQIGTNHLGAFALTNLLLPKITDRVIAVSSVAHRAGKINLADLNYERRGYTRAGAYGASKLANLLFTKELQRRLSAAGSSVRALTVHPGVAATELQSHSGNPIFDIALKTGNIFAQDAAHGALPALYATSQDLPGDTYIGPDGPFEAKGYPKPVGRSRRAQDAESAKGLWELSEQLTGVSFPL